MKKRQGSSDGLCGIYALAWIMKLQKAGPRKFQAKIIALLEAIPESQFTPRKIGFEGFGIKELKSALDKTQSGDRHRLEARFFRQNKEKAERMGLDKMFEAGGMLIAHEDGPGHWLAITKKKKSSRYKVYDPYPKRRIREFSANEVWQESRLLIGPQSFWKTFDAQTH